MNLRSSSRGSSMVIAILFMTIFVLSVLSTVLMLDTLKQEAVYQQGLLQAEASAQTAMEDAIAQLEGGANWRSGFSITDKVFLTGKYSLSISTITHPTITVTGYGFPMRPYRPFRSLELQVEPLPVPQLSSAAVSALTFEIGDGVSWIDSYSSDVSTSPTSFYTSSAAVAANSISWAGHSEPQAVYGNCYYVSSRGSHQNCNGNWPTQIASLTISSFNTTPYATDNDNSLISPQSALSHNTPPNLNLAYGSTVTFVSGVYYLGSLNLNPGGGNGAVIMDVTNGPIIIIFNGNFTINVPMTNTSGYPADVVFYGTSASAGVNIEPGTTYNYYAVFDLNSNFYLYSGVVYGAVSSYGGNVTISNNIGATSAIHYDLALQRSAFTYIRQYSGTYAAPANVKLQ